MKLRIAEVRNERSLTQDELARAIGMSLKGIQYLEYEAKTVRLDVLEKLCTALSCEPGDLFKREVAKNNDETAQRREELRRQKSERMRQYWADKRKAQAIA